MENKLQSRASLVETLIPKLVSFRDDLYINDKLQFTRAVENGESDIGIFKKPGETINEGEILIKVPHELVVTTSNIKKYFQDQNESIDIIENDPKGTILNFLLHLTLRHRNGINKDTPSFFDVWYESLPNTQYNMIYSKFLDDNTIFQGSSIEYAVSTKLRFFQAKYDKLVQEHGDSITLQDIFVIDFLLNSRALEVPESKSSEFLDLGMVPIIDFCNHSFESNCKYEIDFSTNTILLVSTASINDSETKELYINYSGNTDKPLSEFLFNYGFFPKSEYSSSAEFSKFLLPNKLFSDLIEDDPEGTQKFHMYDYFYGPLKFFTVSSNGNDYSNILLLLSLPLNGFSSKDETCLYYNEIPLPNPSDSNWIELLEPVLDQEVLSTYNGAVSFFVSEILKPRFSENSIIASNSKTVSHDIRQFLEWEYSLISSLKERIGLETH